MLSENGSPSVTNSEMTPLDDADKYKWSSTITELPDASAATWGIAFNSRPSKHQYRGNAAWWSRRAKELEDSNKGIFRDLFIYTERNAQNEGTTKRRSGYTGSDSEDEMLANGESLSEPVRKLPPEAWVDLFATVNNNCVRVYRAQHGKKPTLIRFFEDEDEEECFYTVSFIFNADNNNAWWVLAAGAKGVVRVLDLNKNEVAKTLVGHGEAVNHIAVHPRDPALILTASKDESLRMWNLRLGSPIAMFAGLKGHRGEVLSADFDRVGNRFASCGIDNSVRVWEVTSDEQVMSAILESHLAADSGMDKYMYTTKNNEKKILRVPISQFPSFVTRKVHKHYVDCVKWVGDDMILSKSVHNRIYLWQLGNDREALAVPGSDYKLLEEYVIDDCNVWFVKFGIDKEHRTLACGNEKVSSLCGAVF